MEHALTGTAAEHDPDFLARVARRWTDAIDQDGAEPAEEVLRQLQGAFIRRPRHGLQHLEIFATTEQFEHLLTAMNTATNPRTTAGTGPRTAAATEPRTAAAADPETAGAGSSGAAPAGAEPADGSGQDVFVPGLDWRSRQQKLLDGLVGATKAGLASGGLPATGGLRPQVMVTIDYRDLLERLEHPSRPADTPDIRGRGAGGAGGADTAGRADADTADPADPADTADINGADGGQRAGHAPGRGAGPFGFTGTGTLAFTGPVTASTVRKIACDADIIPVLLGSQGRILDIGRTSRVFPPHIRKALTARDQGCSFPDCTIPAPWCEAHHIDYWSRGGTTGTDNGTLLCSHHHHLIHKEQWTIQLRTGVPWFIPPPHLDPRQQPRRNHYFRS
jgi:hypothetical protein